MGIFEDVVDLRGRIRLIDWDRNGPNREKRKVEQQPLHGCGGENRNRVTRFDTEADKAAGGVFDLMLKFCSSDLPACANGGTCLDGDLIRMSRGACSEQVREQLVRRELKFRLDRIRTVTHAFHDVSVSDLQLHEQTL